MSLGKSDVDVQALAGAMATAIAQTLQRPQSAQQSSDTPPVQPSNQPAR